VHANLTINATLQHTYSSIVNSFYTAATALLDTVDAARKRARGNNGGSGGSGNGASGGGSGGGEASSGLMAFELDAFDVENDVISQTSTPAGEKWWR
jgi:hypothetical protein